MRKTVLIISLVTLFAMNANAQPNGNRIGIKVGPTIDWASPGSAAAKREGIGLGFGLGLVYDHYLSDYFAVSSGVNLNFLQMKYSGEFSYYTSCRGDATIFVKIRLNFP